MTLREFLKLDYRQQDKFVARELLKLPEENGFFIDLDCQHYTTDIKDAWEIIDLMIDQGFDDINISFSDTWNVFIHDYVDSGGVGDDLKPATAICIAALLAKGILTK